MSLISGIVGPSIASDATTDAANISAGTQKDIYGKTTALNQPFYNQGLAALPYMNEYTGVSTPDVPEPKLSDYNTPGTPGFMSRVPIGANEGTVDQTMKDQWTPATPGGPDYAAYNAAMTAWKARPVQTAAPSRQPPSYEETVSKPMEAWQYEQSPAYKAKYSLGMEELNKQLQARGLASSGVGATRAAELSRNLTASDYSTERSYKQGGLQDLYKSRYSENTDRYNRLLDQVKMGTGASAYMGQAGNQYAAGIGNAAMAAGEAKAGFYSGLGGYSANQASTGLKAYDAGNKAGWWGQGTGVTQAGADAAATAYAPGMAADTGILYGL